MNTSPAKLNELNHAEEPARALLEQIGWTYVPRDVSRQGTRRPTGRASKGSPEEGLAPTQPMDDGRTGQPRHIRP